MDAPNSQAARKDWLPPTLPSARQAFGYPAFWRDNPVRVALVVVAFAALYFAVASGGIVLAQDPQRVPVYPAAGLLLAVMLLTPRHVWPLWIAAAIGAEWGAQTLFAGPAGTGVRLATALAHALGPALAALLIVQALIQALRLRRPLYFYVMVSLGGATAAVLAAVIVVALRAVESGGDWVALWRTQILALYLGVVYVMPIVVSWTVAGRQVRHHRLPIGPEMLALLLVLAGCVWVTVTQPWALDVNASPQQRLTVYALLSIPCSWAALRFDARAISLSLAAAAASLIIATDQVSGLTALQWYLLALAQTMYLFGVAVLERTRTEEDARVRRTIEGMLMRLSSRFALSSNDDLDELIRATVADIGAFTDADRCALMHIDREAGIYYETHAWSRASGTQTKLIRGLLADYGWTLEQLEASGNVVLTDTHSGGARETAEHERVFGKAGGTAAYNALHFGGHLIGAAGFLWRGRRARYSADMIALLHIFAQLFASLLQRRQADIELRSYQDKLRAMSRELSLSEERARRTAARDLHDGIGQSLALIKIKLQQLRAGGKAEPGLFDSLCDLIEETLQQSRFVIADLSPSVLYDLGLVPAIKWLAGRAEQRDPRVRVAVEETGAPWPLSEDGKVGLFRCVRELFQNALRHSGGDRISVQIEWREDELHLCVSDNGRGFQRDVAFDVGSYRVGESFGLFSVAEAVRDFGGQISAESIPGEGAAVSFHARRERVALDEPVEA